MVYKVLTDSDEKCDEETQTIQQGKQRTRQQERDEWLPQVIIDAWPTTPEGGGSGLNGDDQGEDYRQWKRQRDEAHTHPDSAD